MKPIALPLNSLYSFIFTGTIRKICFERDDSFLFIIQTSDSLQEPKSGAEGIELGKDVAIKSFERVPWKALKGKKGYDLRTWILLFGLLVES